MNTRSLQNNASCIRPDTQLLSRIMGCGSWGTPTLIIELLHCNIEICWSIAIRPHRFPGWRGKLASTAGWSGKGGGDGTADSAHRSCCHHILRFSDGSRVRDVLSLN